MQILKDTLNQLLEQLLKDEMDPFLFKAGASIARDHLMYHNTAGREAQRVVLESAAKATCAL